MYQTGGTIKDTLDDIARHNLVLPAIQREFVWRPEQICGLFDSLMQGYPFGTFLYWQIRPENSGKFTYYDFVCNYHQRNSPDCPRLSPSPERPLTAVLDGQQRLTALNIGFRGSMAWKLPYRRFADPLAYPKRQLHLDLLWKSDDDEHGRKYRFRFLTDEQANRAGQANRHENGKCWFLVKKILEMDSGPPMVRWLNERLVQEHVDDAYEVMFQLHQVAHTKRLIAYYDEKNQELERVLRIFIRMNSGGTTLSYSDLLLSVAVAQFQKHDAREEIRNLVRDLNCVGQSFWFSKDLVLKAGLMLSDIGSVGFKVDNFNKKNMTVLEANWGYVKQALVTAVQLISQLGFSGRTLRAQSALLPIAYYIHNRGHDDQYVTGNRFKEDRAEIREWLIRSIIKASGIWGSGLDTLLTDLRHVIKESSGPFPAAAIGKEMARRGRSLAFQPEEIDDLVDMKYGDSRTFALLSLLFPEIDVEKLHFHIDHVFPRTRFTTAQLRRGQIPEDDHECFQDRRDRLANLQLLPGAENLEKRATMPALWLEETMNANDRVRHVNLHLLGDIMGHGQTMDGFLPFYEVRRCALRDKIAKLLGTQLDQDTEASEATD